MTNTSRHAARIRWRVGPRPGRRPFSCQVWYDLRRQPFGTWTGEMMSRDQRGWLRGERRKAGETWGLRYNVTRASDGKRVEHTRAIGLLSHFPTQSTAWVEVERQNINVNKPHFKSAVAFA